MDLVIFLCMYILDLTDNTLGFVDAKINNKGLEHQYCFPERKD